MNTMIGCFLTIGSEIISMDRYYMSVQKELKTAHQYQQKMKYVELPDQRHHKLHHV